MGRVSSFSSRAPHNWVFLQCQANGPVLELVSPTQCLENHPAGQAALQKYKAVNASNQVILFQPGVQFKCWEMSLSELSFRLLSQPLAKNKILSPLIEHAYKREWEEGGVLEHP